MMPADSSHPQPQIAPTTAPARTAAQPAAPETGFNFAYLDEQTKRSIRRAILKAIAIPGQQIPFSSREMPMSYGWGTGGIQKRAGLTDDAAVLEVGEVIGPVFQSYIQRTGLVPGHQGKKHVIPPLGGGP